MTPENARELLDGTTPAPWEVEESLNGNWAVWVDDGYVQGDIDEQDAILIAAAPELAKTIAGLRYEYAVQLKHGDGWITSRHHTPTVEVAKEIAARYTRTETRIVRHLATDWEVTS